MRTERIDNFPVWALGHVINGEPFEDIEDEQTFYRYYNILRRDLGWRWAGFYVAYDEEEEEPVMNVYFSHFPEFGKACDCVDVIAYTD